MLRTKKAKELLSSSEQDHLTVDANVHTTEQFKTQIASMKELSPNDPGKVCRDCWSIAIKLGMV